MLLRVKDVVVEKCLILMKMKLTLKSILGVCPDAKSSKNTYTHDIQSLFPTVNPTKKIKKSGSTVPDSIDIDWTGIIPSSMLRFAII